MSIVPRIVHQTWKTRSIPTPWLDYQRSWREHHPAWAYHCWTDDENRALVRRHYPWFLATYDGYNEEIKRVDASRYFRLHHTGGLYADLDCEALRPFDDLLEGHDLLLGLEPEAHAAEPGVRSRGLDRIVCNAVMASAPGHPFWDHLFGLLVASSHQRSVLDATGPFLLTRAVQSYTGPGQVTVVGADLLFPVSRFESHDERLSPAQLRERAAPRAYALHHWHGSWRRDQVLRAVRARLREMRANCADDRA